MTVDPLVALEALGYTQREASFMYLAAIHSGYFLRRQFCRFIERKKGWIAQRFVEKARIAGHLEIIDYGQGKYVYHLLARQIYRMIGNEESQSRHRKGDHEIHARLMALDYVLENQAEHFLETVQQKLDFFLNVRGVPASLFDASHGQLHPFLANFPISLVDFRQPSTSVVRFAFMDEGLLSMTKFTRFLHELAPLMLAVRRFEVIYTATSGINFPAAEHVFRGVFEKEVRERQRMLSGISASAGRRPSLALPPLHARFTRLLFHFNYPQSLRSEPRGSVIGSEAGSASSGRIA